jgi:hypothetical protein
MFCNNFDHLILQNIEMFMISMFCNNFDQLILQNIEMFMISMFTILDLNNM